MDPEEFRKRLLEIKNRENTKLVQDVPGNARNISLPTQNLNRPEQRYNINQQPIPQQRDSISEKKLTNNSSNQGMPAGIDENFSLAKKPEGLSREGGLRTIATDMARAVREQELSVIKIALAEQKKREAIEDYKAPTSKKNMSYIFGSLVLLALAGGLIWYFYFRTPKEDVATSTINKSVQNGIIAVDSNKGFKVASLTKEQLQKTIRNEVVNGAVTKNSATNYFFIDDSNENLKIIDSSGFFSKIESHMPGTLFRALDPKFMLGIIDTDKKNPFVILKTTDYEAGFSGMVTWEKGMLDDFYLMWNIDVSGERSTLLGKTFQDTVIKNRDARVLVDAGGKIVLVYVFLNDTTVVISTTDEIIPEIMNRFGTGK